MQVAKENKWQLEILMEKLRSKAAQFKPLPEISKNVRMTLLEKRYALDSVEKSQHQKCLDTLQHSIKVKCLQSMIERLESLTRQLGLRFVVESTGVFIFSDMFYLEIVLEASGVVKDVKIHHEGKAEPQSCAELVACLSRGDFADFTAQLEGFVSIYQLNAEKKVKSKAFTALESLEADLSALSQLQMFIKEPFNLLHKSPVGLLEKRRGGHPMKLTYFVSPYELIDVERGDLDPINIDAILSKGLGHGVTVCMEGSAAHKLQTTTLITVTRGGAKSTPSYSPLTGANSAVIPACLVLKLNRPMPVCVGLVKRLQQIEAWPNEMDSAQQRPRPLLDLVVAHVSDGKLSCANNRGLFVTLPDQTHCYFMTENKNMVGTVVASVPFTHPADVARILAILREQALFNTVVGSCVRPHSRQDFENMTMFEISALSSTQISISLEHPLEESMATADIDLSDISNLVCRIHNPGAPSPGGGNAPDPISELATKVLNKSFSIPITIRAVTKMWEKQASRRALYSGGHENFNLPLGSLDPGGQKGPEPDTDYGGFNDKIKQEPGGHVPNHGTQHGAMMIEEQHAVVWNDPMMGSNFQQIPPSEGAAELPDAWADSSRGAKRRADEELWREGKRKVGDGGDDPELLAETSSSDSVSRSTPLSQETDVTTPNSGLHSDVELSDAAADKEARDFEGCVDVDDMMDELSNASENERTIKATEKCAEDGAGSKLDEKTLAVASVSITAIVGGEAPPGIEIFPVSRSPSGGGGVAVAAPPTGSVTITPVAKCPDDKRPKKSGSRGGRDDKGRPEKKRKRRGEDGSTVMGPPPSKADSSSAAAGKHSGGKPSMSALKSTAGAASTKSGGPASDKTGGKSSRDKDRPRTVFGVGNAVAKSKPPTDGSGDAPPAQQDNATSPGGGVDPKANPNQLRNRKGSLSAIVDKLKQHFDAADLVAAAGVVDKDQSGAATVKAAAAAAMKNPEYMVKPSSDGMKLTINKTRTKENKGGGGGGGAGAVSFPSSGTGSPKIHTGLKPGVNSGPASKKPQQQMQKGGGASVARPPVVKPGGSASASKPSPINNYASGGKTSNSVAKTTPKTIQGSPKLGSGQGPPKDRSAKPGKGSAPEKSIFATMKERGKSSPTPNDVENSFKGQPKVDPYASALVMEGMMKTLDKNFQIPKLSARATAVDDKKKADAGLRGPATTVDTKIFDMVTKNDIVVQKFPLVIPAMNSLEQKFRNNLHTVLGSGSKLKEEHEGSSN
ncbi:mediator of RNA polymerase II transcription subunit 1 [Cylas formicarius]|uniref:mediator of RNA polymerase II transcription subunit 1 n=1 Tax=Cylas formicarius TaxID=197179 RepID=UPI0029584296|nr:mediator of RNA polymerase II transcription subunit 1 [Cylas formicarius]